MAVGLSTFLRRAGVVLMMGRTHEDFDRFVDEACEPLLRAVYLIVRDASAAEDVVQETLLRVARRWPRVRRMRRPGAYARRTDCDASRARACCSDGGDAQPRSRLEL